MKRLTFIFTMIGIITNVYSQSTLQWSKNFEVGISNYYAEYPTIQTDVNTITVTGRKNTPKGQRLMIVKYDLNGDTISTKSFGKDSVSNNILIDYKFDSTNHLYLLHADLLEFNKSKIVLQKYSLNGNLIWVEDIKDIADTAYIPVNLGLANDNFIFITGNKRYDYSKDPWDDVVGGKNLAYLFAYNSDGDQLWKREFNPVTEIWNLNHDLIVHNNTAFLFAFNNSYKNRLVEVDINNNLTINANTEFLYNFGNVQFTPDNNLLISSSRNEYRIFKLNQNGTEIWTNSTNLQSNSFSDEIISTIQDSDGNIYVTGRHYGIETNADILTVKFDNKGILKWQNTYKFGGNNADIGNVITLKNGYVYVGGQSERLGAGHDYDYIVLKIDSATGVSNGVYRYSGVANGDCAISSLSVFDNGNVALTGLSYNSSNYDWTTQLLSDIILSVPDFISEQKVDVYPNPVTSGATLTVKGNGFKEYSVMSSIGQVVQQGKFGKNDFQTIQLENVMTGMYFLSLKTDKELLTRKIIVK